VTTSIASTRAATIRCPAERSEAQAARVSERKNKNDRDADNNRMIARNYLGQSRERVINVAHIDGTSWNL
jgi:hypothetical protein